VWRGLLVELQPAPVRRAAGAHDRVVDRGHVRVLRVQQPANDPRVPTEDLLGDVDVVQVPGAGVGIDVAAQLTQGAQGVAPGSVRRPVG
jgi:hypothetical protein